MQVDLLASTNCVAKLNDSPIRLIVYTLINETRGGIVELLPSGGIFVTCPVFLRKLDLSVCAIHDELGICLIKDPAQTISVSNVSKHEMRNA